MTAEHAKLVWEIVKSVSPAKLVELLTGARKRNEWADLHEPSAVERLAAIGDPTGEAAKRVQRWDEQHARLSNALDRVAAATDRMADAVGKLASE